MTKKQKAFIEKATKERTHDTYVCLFIADTGKEYGGIWGKNGYNNIVIIGQAEDGTLELITDWSDVFRSPQPTDLNIDIQTSNGFVRLWSDRNCFYIPNIKAFVLSDCRVDLVEKVRK